MEDVLMSDAVWIALIAVFSVFVTGTISPMLTAWWMKHLARTEREEDQAEKRLVATKVEETASLLVQTSSEITAQLSDLKKTGNETHHLVNSQLTEVKEALRSALFALLEPRDAASIKAAKKQIADLNLDLAERKAQEKLVDKGKSE